MRIAILSACAAVFMLSVGAQAATECRAPYEPDVPERFGAEAQMMSIYGEVKEFITVKSPEFLACLEVMRGKIDPAADNAAAQKAAIDQRHNDNVDAQSAVNNRFKAAHAIWQEENPD